MQRFSTTIILFFFAAILFLATVGEVAKCPTPSLFDIIKYAVAPDTALLNRNAARQYNAALLVENNRHAEALLAETDRHREEMALYRTLTAASIVVLAVLLLGIALAFIAYRQHLPQTIYILPDEYLLPERTITTRYRAGEMGIASPKPSTVRHHPALLYSQRHRA